MAPLLLLPGMMCDARLFLPQIVAIGAHRPVHFAPITGRDSISALAAEVLSHAPPRFALAGMSMGGIVAMEVFRQAPGRIERLALLDTNPCPDIPEMKAQRRSQMEKARAGGLQQVMVDEWIPKYVTGGHGKSTIHNLCLSMAMDLGIDVFLRQSTALRDRPDQQETLSRVRVPTLVLMGAEDRLCTRERHELMQSLIPGARLEIIEGAAHLPTLEQPEGTTEALGRWLNNC